MTTLAEVFERARAAAEARRDMCYRAEWWFGGCKFQPRYDLGAPSFQNFKNLEMHDSSDIERFRPKTYVHDICVRCGKVIKRDGDAQ